MADKRILIVDDNSENQQRYKEMLERYGYIAAVAGGGQEALAKLTSFDPTLILLDVDLAKRPKGDPYVNGYEVCRKLREHPGYKRGKGKLLVMISSIFTDDIHREFGYEKGVDRYLVSPITPGLLRAEIEALWPPEIEELSTTWLQVNEGLQVHAHEPCVKLKCAQQGVEHKEQVEEQRPMSLLLYKLLRYLMDHSNANKPCSRKELLENIWGVEEKGWNQLLDSAIYDLRRVLECDPSKPQYIQTVRGFGYKFVR
jgi:DNA-binding response OmpR family regulator